MAEHSTSPVVYLSGSAGVRGKLGRAEDCATPVSVFCGIPYAKPPVGKLRFRPPEPPELWDGVRDFTKYGPISPQNVSQIRTAFDIKRSMLPVVNCETSEDCLYLNIWTPNLDEGAKLPVMIWIHGGSFVVGSGDTYDGTALAGMNHVVYISINYRLGVLGFLTTGDDVAPGNYALLDQIEAMRWVSKYIHKFGGDRDNVTLFGESAGGMSASLHILSSLSEGLFHKVICESGVANSTFVVRSRKQEFEALSSGLQKLGYKGKTSEELLDFLQNKSPEELLSAFDRLFKVVIDGKFLTDYPHNIIKTDRAQRIPVLNGHNTHEANFMVNVALSPDLVGQPDDHHPIRGFVKQIVEYAFSENIEAITDAMMAEYVGGVDDPHKQGSYEIVIELCSDVIFNAAAHEFSRLHSVNAPVYMYLFAHRPSYTDVPDWVISDHTDEVAYSFGFPFLVPPCQPRVDYTEEEKQLSKLIMTYWTNFARNGDPNNEGIPFWPRYNPEMKEYLLLKPQPKTEAKYKTKKMEFWEKIIPLVDTGRIYS